MSLNYTHLLIAGEPSYCPTPAQVTEFLRLIAKQGFIGLATRMEYCEVTKMPREIRRTVNPFTRSTTESLTPSRKRGRCKAIDEVDELATALVKLNEYEVSLTTEVKPKQPPLDIGTTNEAGDWEAFDKSYSFELVCCARECAVMLGQVEKPNSPTVRQEELIPTEF